MIRRTVVGAQVLAIVLGAAGCRHALTDGVNAGVERGVADGIAAAMALLWGG